MEGPFDVAALCVTQGGNYGSSGDEMTASDAEGGSSESGPREGRKVVACARGW